MPNRKVLVLGSRHHLALAPAISISFCLYLLPLLPLQHTVSGLPTPQVINVGGHRIGTEEIESVLLLDSEHARSPLRNCVVVGMPDRVLGTVPVAFVVLQPDATLSAAVEGRMRALVQGRLSYVAEPAKFVVAGALPETYSGKYSRRLLQLMLSGAPLGDLGALKNPDCVEPLKAVLADAPISAQPAETMAMVLEVLKSLIGSEQLLPSMPLMDLGAHPLHAPYCVLTTADTLLPAVCCPLTKMPSLALVCLELIERLPQVSTRLRPQDLRVSCSNGLACSCRPR